MSTPAHLIRYLPDLPPLALISAWQRKAGQWMFRLLDHAEVIHRLRVVAEQVEVFDDASKRWQLLGILDVVPVWCRPVDYSLCPVPWDRVYKAAGLRCPLTGE